MSSAAGCRLAGTARPDVGHTRTIGFLVSCYWRTIYNHLRGRGYDHERAQDLTQGFFQEVVLERDLIGQVDPAKGSFRAFLFVALCRYLINVRKRENARGRIPPNKLTPLDTIEPSRLPRCTPKSTPVDARDSAWLSQMLASVLEQIRAEYQAKGMPTHWHLFREYVLRPVVDQTDRPPLKEVSEKYGVEEAKASNMVVTVKRRFAKLLMEHLRRRAISDEAAQGEMEEIRKLVQEIAGRRGGKRRPGLAS